jgi:long-chain alkane monooxygenase
MNYVAHQSPRLWTHRHIRAIVPICTIRSRLLGSNWQKLLERGEFDAPFLADVLSVYDVYRGSPDAANCEPRYR